MVRKLCIALLATAIATQTASAQTGKGGILSRMKDAVTRSQRSVSSSTNRAYSAARTQTSSYRSAPKKATDVEVDRAVATATGRIAARPVSATKPAQAQTTPAARKPVAAPTPAKVVSQTGQVPVQAVPMRRLAPTPSYGVPSQSAIPVYTAGHHQISYGDAAMPMGYPVATGQYPRTSAALYPAPQPNIPYQVGMTQITNPAFAPHEMLYAHEYRAIYPPYYYKVRGGWMMTPFGVWSHEKWRPVGREVSVKYRSRISPFAGFVPPNN